MTTFDITPLFRTTAVGIDRALGQLQSTLNFDGSGFPACDVLRLDEDRLRISLAVPGYRPSEITVETHDRTLRVKGDRDNDPDHNRYLYKGVVRQAFQRTFQLPEHVRVTTAELEHGLLHIDLLRELPEALRPRRIEVRSAEPAREPRKLDGVDRAA